MLQLVKVRSVKRKAQEQSAVDQFRLIQKIAGKFGQCRLVDFLKGFLGENIVYLGFWYM